MIGYVAAFPIPEVVRGINGFTLGVRSVNPAAQVKVVWTNTWYDPVKEREAAVALLDAGADIIGINNRNLDTFEVDVHHSVQLISHIPDTIVTVSESGIHHVQTAMELRHLGFHAVLVGEALVTSSQPQEFIKQLKHIS